MSAVYQAFSHSPTGPVSVPDSSSAETEITAMQDASGVSGMPRDTEASEGGHVEVAICYQCPGEAVPISRSTHLARLAAGYQACRECPHRRELGHLNTIDVRLTSQAQDRPDSVFTRDGVRGSYCNEITRTSLSRIAAAVARAFWEEANPEQMQRRLQLGADADRDLRFRRQRRACGLDETIELPPLSAPVEPPLILGYDSRFSSPELAQGVGEILKRWGCDVLDVGCVSRPEFDFAVSRWPSNGGVFVTGGVAPADQNGLDVVDAQGWDWTLDDDWRAIEQRVNGALERPVRSAGRIRSISTRTIYLDHLRLNMHGLRPLRVAVGCAETRVGWLLPEMCRSFGGTMLVHRIPQTFGGRMDPPDALADEMYELLRTGDFDLGFLIGADGRSCYLMDERGEVLLPDQAIQLLQFGAFPEVTTDHCGRYWLRPGSPCCDALLTLSRLLHSLSRSDCPMSRWLED